MTAIILDILAVIFGVLVAPLCVIGIVQPKTRIGHLARIGAGTSIVLFFLVVWGNTGRDPLQWSYCFVARSAHSCRDIKWSQWSTPGRDAKSDAPSSQAATPTPFEQVNGSPSAVGGGPIGAPQNVADPVPPEATDTAKDPTDIRAAGQAGPKSRREVETSPSPSARGTGEDRQFAPGLSLGAVKTIVPPDLQAAGFMANGSGLTSASSPIAIVQGLWASFTPGKVVRPCRPSDSMYGNSVRGTVLRYFQVYDGRFVGGGQQLIRRVNGKMLVMNDGTWGIRIINQDRIESVDFKDGSIGYIATRCR